MGIFGELQRRNVIRVAIAYGVASWVLLQIVDVITPIFELPDWAPKLIFVILAIGLVPALIFSWAFEITPEGLKKDSEVDHSASIANKTGKKLDYIIIGTLAVAVVLLLLDRQFNHGVDEPAVATADTSVVADDVQKSIAVLPFVNMSSDAEQEYFSDGITEEILNSLAGIKELKVAGRTSSFAFKGQNDDLRRIGDALGVSHILEGSVRKSGAQVRITAQLIQVDNGFHLWSETYDRELTDVFAIQDEIANEILKQLKSKLLTGDVVVAEAKRTNPEVYALYLKAKQRIYTRIGSEIELAVTELDEASQLDPEYAPALAQRGIATMLLSDEQYGSIPSDEANRRGKRFIDQALRLNPNLAEGLAGLGLYYTRHRVNADQAIDTLVRALEINPNLVDASNWLQIGLRDAGDMRGALEVIEEVAERDPLYRPAFANAMMMFNNFGMTDKADALLERMEVFDPDSSALHLARATNYAYSGQAGKSLREVEILREVSEISGVGEIYLSIGLLRTGQIERAAVEGSPYFRPDALFILGKKEEAIELAYEQASSGFPETLFLFLNREKRYQEIVNFLEERWPNLAAFAGENPGSDFGYPTMSSVALAYSKLGNQERAEEALLLVDRRISSLAEQGINNFAFAINRAIHHAMLGEKDAAFDQMRVAVDGGWANFGESLNEIPELENLYGDPRLAEMEAMMLETMNRDRAIVGLPLLNANFEVEQNTLNDKI